jgi:hypothetical protein
LRQAKLGMAGGSVAAPGGGKRRDHINSAFINSFYGNHVRGRPSVAASAPILVYIARLTCLSMKQTKRVRKEARSKVIAEFARWRTRYCMSYFRCLQLTHAVRHSFEEPHVASAVKSDEHPPFWSRLRRLVGPARRIRTCRACPFSELANWIEIAATGRVGV